MFVVGLGLDTGLGLGLDTGLGSCLVVEADALDVVEHVEEVGLDGVWVRRLPQDLQQGGVGHEEEAWEQQTLLLQVAGGTNPSINESTNPSVNESTNPSIKESTNPSVPPRSPQI